MKKHIAIIAAALLFTACTTKEKTVTKETEYITIDLTISKIEKTYFITTENEQSYYYTVYAIDNNGDLYCICDDMEKDCVSGYEYMLILGNSCQLIYEKGKPDSSGYIIPIE